MSFDTFLFRSLRKEGDSNPRYPNRVRQFSKLVVSATHPSFLTDSSVKEWCKCRQKKLLCKISATKFLLMLKNTYFYDLKVGNITLKW